MGAKSKKSVKTVSNQSVERSNSVSKPSNKRRWPKVVIPILVVLFVIGFAALAYQYTQTKNELNKVKDPKTAAKTEAAALAAKIGKTLDLPKNEKPTVATVSDKSKLQDQPFFERVEDGDKVLVYTKSQRAVLYRPSSNKIIEYAPVNLSNN